MTQSILTLKEISNRIAQRCLYTSKGTETTDRNGVIFLRTHGYLDNERIAAVQVIQHGEMVNVRLVVPGAGDMGFDFALFADDATEERIERYLKHYLGRHEKAKAKWDASMGSLRD